VVVLVAVGSDGSQHKRLVTDFNYSWYNPGMISFVWFFQVERTRFGLILYRC